MDIKLKFSNAKTARLPAIAEEAEALARQEYDRRANRQRRLPDGIWGNWRGV